MTVFHLRGLLSSLIFVSKVFENFFISCKMVSRDAESSYWVIKLSHEGVVGICHWPCTMGPLEIVFVGDRMTQNDSKLLFLFSRTRLWIEERNSIHSISVSYFLGGVTNFRDRVDNWTKQNKSLSPSENEASGSHLSFYCGHVTSSEF